MLLAATRARTVPETTAGSMPGKYTQDGYEDESAARTDEDAEDAGYEPDYGKCQPLDCLLPTESRQPLDSGAGEPVQPRHLVHRQGL